MTFYQNVHRSINKTQLDTLPNRIDRQENLNEDQRKINSPKVHASVHKAPRNKPESHPDK